METCRPGDGGEGLRVLVFVCQLGGGERGPGRPLFSSEKPDQSPRGKALAVMGPILELLLCDIMLFAC